jgi:hypothetical protein
VLDQHRHCASCGATIDLDRLAWVLARVERPLDWSTRQLALDQGTLEVLDAIGAADPTFDAEVFADRVMALCPRLMQAIQDPSCPLARVGIAPHLRRAQETMRAVRDRLGWRAVIDSTGVSGVTISSADHKDCRDSISVDIASISARYEIDAAGQVVTGDRIPRCIVDRWLDDEGCCAHCGAEVTLGTQDWVLSRMSAYQDVLPATDPPLVE